MTTKCVLMRPPFYVTDLHIILRLFFELSLVSCSELFANDSLDCS